MFWPFPNWPSSGWNTLSEELYTYYNTIISVSEYIRGGGTRSRLQKAARLCTHGANQNIFITSILLRMHGAILPRPHMPSWYAQGQLYLCLCLVYSFIPLLSSVMWLLVVHDSARGKKWHVLAPTRRCLARELLLHLAPHALNYYCSEDGWLSSV